MFEQYPEASERSVLIGHRELLTRVRSKFVAVFINAIHPENRVYFEHLVNKHWWQVANRHFAYRIAADSSISTSIFRNAPVFLFLVLDIGTNGVGEGSCACGCVNH